MRELIIGFKLFKAKKSKEEFTVKQFIIPSEGNLITQRDIDKGIIRITVDFMRYFPTETGYVDVSINGIITSVRFVIRQGERLRSHLLHINQNGMQSLNLARGDSVKFTQIGENTYQLEKVK